MTNNTGDPVDHHVNTLRRRERYGSLDEEDLEATETTIDDLAFTLDGSTASVVDDVGDRDGNYENSAAFISRQLGDQPSKVSRIEGGDNVYGFVAEYTREEEAQVKNLGPMALARIPREVALIFDVPEKDQYDIKIE